MMRQQQLRALFEGLVDGGRHRIDGEQDPLDLFVGIAADQPDGVPRLAHLGSNQLIQHGTQIAEPRHGGNLSRPSRRQYRGRSGVFSCAGGTMLYFDGVGGLIFVALWIFCFIDVLLTPEARAATCRSWPGCSSSCCSR